MNKTEICTILSNTQIAQGIFKMGIKSRNICKEAIPGQFLHVQIPHDSSLILRRPISINDIDMEEERVDIVYQLVGKGTNILSTLQAGDCINVLGPLGNGFIQPKTYNNIYIIGGGCGVAPLKFFVNKHKDKHLSCFLGYRNRESSYQIEDFQMMSSDVRICTDDGSLGYKGFVNDILSNALNYTAADLIVACGPIPMLVGIQTLSNRYDIPCQISLEERMGCGVGGCLVCVCKIKASTPEGWTYKKVCTDGPVFWAKEVVLADE
ncbi:MAG: dihydroorotate dehydrogenase electron transfer subunit [Xylanivirga thermophila]|jgi:dihydroorotate dehydrogenase electron transfer subunit|uniref:dihydroorotate dehydrogenase electron transfer subunit n=1 Tax=Xylanivirga thermophila TaxID=2496273 RepID=UPI0039F4B479